MSVNSKLRLENPHMRGWLLDILLCIEQINEEEFSLQDVYEFEDILSQKHPQNKNVKAKIRHQLQLLRDKGGITFLVTATIEYLDNRFCVDSEKPKSQHRNLQNLTLLNNRITQKRGSSR